MTAHSELRRKAVREDLAQMFERMAARAGATCQRDRYEIDGPREITLHITLDGCTVNVDLDGDSRVNAFLGHWFFDDRRGRLFVNGFDGSGYRSHHKATSMTEHAEDLCDMIEARLEWIGDGTAFVLEETT